MHSFYHPLRDRITKPGRSREGNPPVDRALSSGHLPSFNEHGNLLRIGVFVTKCLRSFSKLTPSTDRYPTDIFTEFHRISLNSIPSHRTGHSIIYPFEEHPSVTLPDLGWSGRTIQIGPSIPRTPLPPRAARDCPAAPGPQQLFEKTTLPCHRANHSKGSPSLQGRPSRRLGLKK